MKVGILALQGDVGEHATVLRGLGVKPVAVRGPADMEAVDSLILPGGESTTVSLLADAAGLTPVLSERLKAGMPAMGTCAGMILLASELNGGRDDQVRFAAIDITVRRNGFGTQIDSFEVDLDVATLEGGPFKAVFIRAPVVERAGPQVEVLASVESGDGQQVPVLCRQGEVLVSAFHPELSGDRRLHRMFLDGP